MRDLPADAVIRRVVEATCLLPLNAVAFEGAQRVANLGKLAAAAGGLARDGKLSLEEVTEALREGGLSNFEADSPLADDADDAVRICTIHKMKGLENRIVFLPDLAREDRPGRSDRLDVGAVRLPEGRQFLALKVGELANSVHIWKDEEDRLHEEAEEIRVLYVAMTRAKQRLVVVAGRSRRDSLGIEALRAWGYSVDDPPADGATLVGGSVLHRQVIPEAPSRQPAGNTRPRAESAVGAYESAVEKLTAAAAPVFRSPSGSREESELALRPHERESALRPGADRGAPGKAVGILLHRWLERWNGKDQEDLRDTFRGLCRAVATAEDVDPQDLEREGGAILEKFLAGPLAQRFREVTHVGRELPMLLRDPSGTIYRGSIDLLYRDGAGDPIIADYKTDRETDESALRERYREQLGIYADAVRQALDLPRLPRAELWSLRTGHRIAIDWNETPSR
jgi:ATP-dependent exoDNAse (exonuclease V) beta subunit